MAPTAIAYNPTNGQSNAAAKLKSSVVAPVVNALKLSSANVIQLEHEYGAHK
jgi:hypothetical protein